MTEKRYAKEQENGSLIVGTGTDVEFYKSIGMELMSVEKGWDGAYYKEGQAPEKPRAIIIEEELNEQQNILSSTDWYAIRYADSGVEIPADIKAKRQAAREKIDELRAEIEDLAKELRATDETSETETVNDTQNYGSTMEENKNKPRKY